MAGRIAVEQPAALPWNQWPTCSGMGGRNGVESVAGMAWNTHQQDSILVVPIFGIEKPDRPLGFPPIMTARIKALMYNQFFYCPKTPPGMTPIEGVARLDRIQVIFPVQRASYNPLPIRLSDDALPILMNLLREWLRVKGTSEDETYLRELKELLKETLPDSSEEEIIS
jgi:hypothetical protein